MSAKGNTVHTCNNIKRVITLTSTAAFTVKSNIQIDMYDFKGNKKEYNNTISLTENISQNSFSIKDIKKVDRNNSILKKFMRNIEKCLFYK